MSNEQKIPLLKHRLETAKQELADQLAQAKPSQDMIAILQSEITFYEAELQRLLQPGGSSSHRQTISGNAQVDVAISGHAYGPISHQSAPSTYFNAPVYAGNLATGQQDIERMAITMGDSKNITISGNTNSVVGVESTFSNVQAQISSQPAATPDKQELEHLVKKFHELLKQAEAQGKQAEVQTLAKRVDAAVEEVSSPNPDRDIVVSNLESLKKAVKNIETVWPIVFNVAMQIATKIQALLPS